MAKESDRKTIRGVLNARIKGGDILATLIEIDPENDDVRNEVRRARGLAAGLDKQLARVDEVITHVNQGRRPPQMDFSEVMRSARAVTPNLRDEEAEDIRKAAESGGVYDEEDEDDDDQGEPAVPANPAAANATTFFAPAAVLAEKLASQGRPLPGSFLETWSGEDRSAAMRWVDNRIQGGNAPVPEILGKRYMEDLDLDQPLGRVELMVWLGLAPATQVEAVRQGLDVPDYAGNDWEDVAPWAIAAHRRDRGEAIVVPNPIHHILPTRAQMAALKENLAEQGEASIEEVIAREAVFPSAPSTYLAVQTLIQALEIVRGDDDKLHAARPDLVDTEDSLFARAFDIATRGTKRVTAEEAGVVDEGDDPQAEPIPEEVEQDGGDSGDEVEQDGEVGDAPEEVVEDPPEEEAKDDDLEEPIPFVQPTKKKGKGA